MSARRTASLYYKFRKPVPTIQALPGDLLAVHPEKPPAERYVLLRETAAGLQRRALEEQDALDAAALGISTHGWRAGPRAESPPTLRRVV